MNEVRFFENEKKFKEAALSRFLTFQEGYYKLFC